MKILFRWVPAILIMTVIFLLSSIPSDNMPSFRLWDMLIKKGGHVLGFGLLGFACWYGLMLEKNRIWMAFLITLAYALLDEFHQAYVPGRNPSLVDALLFDTGGAVMTLMIAWGCKERSTRRFI